MPKRGKINIDQLLVDGLSSKVVSGKSAIQLENKLKSQSRGISGHKLKFVEAPNCLQAFELVDFNEVKMLEAIDAFVGANSGVMKGLYIKKAKFVNFRENRITNSEFEQRTNKIDLKSQAILAMSFTGSDQTEILIGRKNGRIALLNTLTEQLSPLFEMPDNSCVKGVHSIKDRILTASNSGSLAIWNGEGERLSKLEWTAGENLLTMRLACGDSPNVFATGGKENPLKLWDMEEQKCKFIAKNVRPDNLELRVPIWVTNCRFLDPSANSIVTSTGNAQIRVYDIRTQRRPVLQENWMEGPIQALSTCHREWNVLAGNNSGELGLLDLRSNNKSRIISKYKGFAGSIRCIDASPNQPHVISCGIDRFAILHNLDSREIIQKIYCKVQLNCCLLRGDNSLMFNQESSKKYRKRKY